MSAVTPNRRESLTFSRYQAEDVAGVRVQISGCLTRGASAIT